MDIFTAIAATAELMGSPLKPEAIALMVDDLSEYDEQNLAKALKQLRQKGGRFTVSAIIDQLPDSSGYPSPEEAWNALPKSEYESGFVCQPMMDGWGACSDSLSRNDYIGARMAFIERYKKSVSDEKFAGGKPSFWYLPPDIGTSEQNELAKEQAIVQARTKGWIGTEQTQGAMNQLNGERVTTPNVRIEQSNGAEKYLTQEENKDQVKGLKKLLSPMLVDNGSQTTEKQ